MFLSSSLKQRAVMAECNLRGRKVPDHTVFTKSSRYFKCLRYRKIPTEMDFRFNRNVIFDNQKQLSHLYLQISIEKNGRVTSKELLFYPFLCF